MSFNKNTTAVVMIFISAMSLFSCDNSSWKKRSDENQLQTSFSLDELTHKSQVTKSDKTFQIAQAKSYQYKACLEDQINDGNIQKRRFSIWDGDRKVATDESDGRGCVEWVEEYEYNSLQNSQKILLKRRIQSESKNGGQIEVSFYINPWAHGPEEKELELAKGTPQLQVSRLSQLQEQLKLSGRRPQPLWVEDVVLKYDPGRIDSQKNVMPLRLSFVPKVLVIDGKGFYQPKELTSGEFEMDIFFIYSYSPFRRDENGRKTVTLQKVRITGAVDPETGGESENPFIYIDSVDKLTEKQDLGAQFSSPQFMNHFLSLRLWPQQGTLALGMILRPLNGPENLTEFQGVFPIGDVQSLKSYQRIELSEDVQKRGDEKNRFLMSVHLSDDQDESAELLDLKCWLKRQRIDFLGAFSSPCPQKFQRQGDR